jgi:uncharacterized membrane protein
MPAKMRLTWLIIFLGTLVLTGSVLAQVSTNFDLSWHLLSGGGGSRGSANYQISDSLGQWAGGLVSGSSYRIESGFWYGTVISEKGREIYLPLILKNQG